MAQLSLILLQSELNRICPLSEHAWAAVKSLATTRRVAAGEHLLRAGEVSKRILFVISGHLREYYVDINGKQSVRRFCRKGEFSGSLADLLTQQPAAVFIDALEPCELIELDWLKIDALSQQHPSLMQLMRRIAEGLYIRKMQREFEMLTLTATERYHQFSKDNPELESHLPRHMLASYLGITAVHLSRICAGEKSTK